MREIKFRAWDRKKKQMFLVHNIKFDRIDYSLNLIEGYGDEDFEGYKVYGGGIMNYANKPRYVLMQYIGLNDKNGKKSFEADIIRNKAGLIGVIVFHEFAWKMQWKSGEYYPLGQEFEIIGNIFNDPGLMEGK